MPKSTGRPPWAPPVSLVEQVKSGDVFDFDALMSWYMAPDTPGWLRSLPADLAVLMADQGVPAPTHWATASSSVTDV